MNQKVLKTAVIGLGVGAQHALAYHANSKCELVQVCDIDPEKLSWAKNEFPIVECTTDAKTILNNPDIDLVSIASFDQDHAEQILLGLENDKHLFVEKPLCLLKSEAEAIAKALQNKPHLKISSNLILRKYPLFEQLKAWIESGKLGTVYSIEGDYNYGRLHKILEGWRGKTPNYSITFGGSVHLIDAFQWLLGTKPSHVSSISNKICSADSNFKNPDFITSIFDWNGIVAKITANFGCVQPHFHNLKVYGTKATFVHGLNGTFIASSRDPNASLEMLDIPYPGCKKGDLIAPFVNDILENTTTAITKKQIFDTLSICLSVDQSHQTRTTLEIDYLN